KASSNGSLTHTSSSQIVGRMYSESGNRSRRDYRHRGCIAPPDTLRAVLARRAVFRRRGRSVSLTGWVFHQGAFLSLLPCYKKVDATSTVHPPVSGPPGNPADS